ncbi:MAG: hypothetical protein HRU09_14270 [Oligoflexales bacterium]|nr:hypothetical protein [Oligoflexales bacterium]
MHNYEEMRKKYSRKVCQTVDTPIMVFDIFMLGEIFVALGSLTIFGIIIYSWQLMFLSLFITLGVIPAIRRRNNRGIFLHYPYKRFGMNLPGIVNPRGNKIYSD